MYEIISDENFKRFQTKVLEAKDNYVGKNKSYIDCLGYYHKTNSFELYGDRNIELTYRHKINEYTFKIIIWLVEADYSINIENNNRCYYEYKAEQTSYTNGVLDTNISKKNVRLFGITIGDLFKYFNHINEDNKKLEIIGDEYESTENEKAIKLLKKSHLIDTSFTNCKDVLGLYSKKCGSIYLWENLRNNGFIDSGSNNFVAFCKKIVYFSANTIVELMKISAINDNCKKLFNSLSDKTIISRLLRYFMYNENPEFYGTFETFYFETPTSVPDILQYFYRKTNDNRYDNLYRKIMKQLNSNQKNQLESKYKSQIFSSVYGIPKEYPIFALRNILLKQWTMSGYKDLQNVEERYYDYMRRVKNDKYKHKKTVTNKKVYFNERKFPNDKYSKGKNKFSDFRDDLNLEENFNY